MLFITKKKKMKKYNYFFNKHYWYQSQLTFGEDTTIRNIIKESGFTFPDGEDAFPELIDKIYLEKPEIFINIIAIVLKEDNSNIWKILYNKFNPIKDKTEYINSLTKGELAVILADFFTLRLNWITDLLLSKDTLISDTKLQKKMAKKIRQLKSATDWQSKIMSEQKN